LCGSGIRAPAGSVAIGRAAGGDGAAEVAGARLGPPDAAEGPPPHPAAASATPPAATTAIQSRRM